MKKIEVYDLIIIGAGPAGLTAAHLAARRKINYLILGHPQKSQIYFARKVDQISWSGSGQAYLNKLLKKIKSKNLKRVSVQKIIPGRYIKIFSKKKIFLAKTALIASGAKPRHLHQNSRDYTNIFLTKPGGKTILIIGAGRNGLTNSLYLAKTANKIVIIDKRGPKDLDQKLLSQVLQNKKIEVILNTEIEKYPRTNFDIIYEAMGTKPFSEFLSPQILDREGYLKLTQGHMTKIKGLYACGDCRKGCGSLPLVINDAEKAMAEIFIYLHDIVSS